MFKYEYFAQGSPSTRAAAQNTAVNTLTAFSRWLFAYMSSFREEKSVTYGQQTARKRNVTNYWN